MATYNPGRKAPGKPQPGTPQPTGPAVPGTKLPGGTTGSAGFTGPTGPTGPTWPGVPSAGGTGPTGVSIPPAVSQPTSPPAPGTGPVDGVDGFLALLRDDELNIEAPVSEAEVSSALTLFSICTVLLAGLGQRRVGNEIKIDVLGMLTLNYGLQDKSLSGQIALDAQALWNSQVDGTSVLVRDELQALRNELDNLGQDVVFLTREARRQFNLGITNEVAANVTFPSLVSRYVAVATDPLLTMNLRQEEQPGSFTKKDRIATAFDLLSELKSLVLQIVRSLSKFGTVAVDSSNRRWAAFESRALRVLKSVGRLRYTQDDDDKRILSVLADLTGKNQDTVVAPYFTLARNGGRLLALAFETYLACRSNLDDFEREHLLDLFQPQGSALSFRTTQMRREALVLKRYPLANWN